MNLMKSKTAAWSQGPEREDFSRFGAEALAFISDIRLSNDPPGGGGAGRDRTGGLRLAKAALPQLSYSPMDRFSETRGWWA